MLTDEAKEQYALRNALLQALGFKNYSTYLKSETWKKIRHRVLLASPPCSACTRRATQVHHKTYTRANLQGTSLEGLVAVCGRCHKICEYSKKGTKLGPCEATAKLGSLQQHHDRQARDATKHRAWPVFFAVVAAMRQYVGMDATPEALALCERYDLAKEALPDRERKARGRRH